MKKSLKTYLIVFFALSSMTALIIASVQKEKNPHTNTLTVGLQSGYPPFEYIDETGALVGFDIDVGKALAIILNKKLVLKDMEFDGEILALKQGKIDLIISGMNITPSREKEILMVPYYGNEGKSLSLIFWGKIPPHISSLEDLQKYPSAIVTVGSGTIPELYMMTKFPMIKIKSFEGELSGLMDVKFGKSIANLVESDVAEYLQKKYAEIQILPVIIAKEEKIGGFGIGVNKNNSLLFQSVQDAIQELKANGELQHLENKWFKSVNP